MVKRAKYRTFDHTKALWRSPGSALCGASCGAAPAVAGTWTRRRYPRDSRRPAAATSAARRRAHSGPYPLADRPGARCSAGHRAHLRRQVRRHRRPRARVAGGLDGGDDLAQRGAGVLVEGCRAAIVRFPVPQRPPGRTGQPEVAQSRGQSGPLRLDPTLFARAAVAAQAQHERGGGQHEPGQQTEQQADEDDMARIGEPQRHPVPEWLVDLGGAAVQPAVQASVEVTSEPLR